MGRWQNFAIWRGKLPHWRADGVTYYVTFRHRRELNDLERRLLFANLLRPEGKRWSLMILCVLPGKSELIVDLIAPPSGAQRELSDIVEKAKNKAGSAIIKRSGERFAPFYGESFDRILRDEGEISEYWDAILTSPVEAELVEDPEDWDCLFVADHPSNP